MSVGWGSVIKRTRFRSGSCTVLSAVPHEALALSGDVLCQENLIMLFLLV